MAEPKTRPTEASVAAYLEALPDPRMRADCRTLAELMSRASGEKPVLWGTSIVGFGSYRYTYASGQSGDWPLTGFAPRAKDLTIYVMDGFDQRAAALARLGPHKHSKSCLYLKSLATVDLEVLEEMIADSVAVMRARWPARAAETSAAPAQPKATSSKPAGGKAAAKKAGDKTGAPRSVRASTSAKDPPRKRPQARSKAPARR